MKGQRSADKVEQIREQIRTYLLTKKFDSSLPKAARANVRKQAKHYRLKGEELFLMKGGKERRVVESLEERKELLQYFHASPEGGHSGVNVTRKKLAACFFWERMEVDVKTFISTCTCQRVKHLKVEQPELQHIRVSETLELVGMDLIEMAGKVVDVDEMMNTVLVCDTCTEPFDSTNRVPRLLPCRHSFCTPCLETYSKGGNFNCPTCRHPITLNGSPAASLPRDIISLKVVDYLTMKAAPRAIPCHDCPDHSTANFRCLTCGLSMCEECRRAHVRVPQTRNHQIRAISELLASPRDFLQEVEMCSRHPGLTLNLYCSSPACKTALCTTCAMVGHPQDRHTVEEISEVYKKAGAEVADLKTSLKQEEMKCHDASAEVCSKLETVEACTAKATESINAGVNIIKKALKRRRLELLQQVKSIKVQHQTALQKDQGSIQSRLDKVREAGEFLKRAESLARPAELLTVLQEQVPSVRQLLQSPAPHHQRPDNGSFSSGCFAFGNARESHGQGVFEIDSSLFSNAQTQGGFSAFGSGFHFAQKSHQQVGFAFGKVSSQGNAGCGDKTSMQFESRGQQQLLDAVNSFGAIVNLWPSQ